MVDERRAAGGGKLGLGLAVDDLEIEPDLVRDTGAEFGAVLRRAAGLRCNEPRAGDTTRLHLVPADGKRLDRAHDRRIADAAGGRNALTQPYDAGERVDNPEAVAGRTRHQEAAIVGAEVERRIGRNRRSTTVKLARIAIRRSPTPRCPPTRAPVTRRVEAPRIAGLVIHSDCLPGATRASRSTARDPIHLYRNRV